MPRNPWGIPIKPIRIQPIGFDLGRQKKKGKTLTSGQRIYIWERPNIYGRTCSICHNKITKLSDLDLDHTRAYSKGGTKLALAHKICNRLKASGSLRQIQKKLGIKTKNKRQTRRKHKTKGKFWVNPLTGRKERVRPLFRI